MAKKRNYKKFGIDNPKVAQYIIHYATPDSLRPEDEKTDTAYMKKYNIKSTTSLSNYAKIAGFQAAVAEARMRWRNHYIKIADEAIERRAKGLIIKTLGYNKAGEVSFKTAMEVPPSEKAAEIIYRIFGDLNEKEAKANAQAIIEAAAELDLIQGDKKK